MARTRPTNPDERAVERSEHAADELNIPPPTPDKDKAPVDDASKAKNERETGPPAQLGK